MKFQLALILGMILISLTVKSEAATNRTECTTDNLTVTKETQKFYCISTKIYDKVESVSCIKAFYWHNVLSNALTPQITDKIRCH